jgi:hypothetical protein
MSAKKHFTPEQAREIGEKIGIDFNKARFDLEDFRYGMDVELEHGKEFDLTNVTGDDPVITGKISWAHLREFPDYYQRLKKMEEEAKKYWEEKGS